MKFRFLLSSFRFAVGLPIGCLLASATRAQSPGNAPLSGQVSNAATGSFLEGAVVAVANTNRTTTTDREGRFEWVHLRVVAGGWGSDVARASRP